MDTILFFQSSIGKKTVMSVTGILMSLFLVGHLVGNFLLFVGKDEFNAYADFLNGTKLTVLAEIGLSLALILHIYSAAKLTRENNMARSRQYVYKSKAGAATWTSSHMLHSGMFTFLFLIVHLWTFKLGDWSNTPESSRTLYDLVVNSFADFIYAFGYVIAMVLLGLHLHHAIKSAFQTLGLRLSDENKNVTRLSVAFSIFIAAGYSSFPIYFFCASLVS